MEFPEDKIPLPLELGGEQVYADFGSAIMVHFTAGEDCAFSDECFERCSPDSVIDFAGHNAIASYTMQRALIGETGQEELVMEVHAMCKGQKGIFRKRCGAQWRTTQVAMPYKKPEDEAE